MNFCLHGSARTVREAVEPQARRRARLRSDFFADSQMGNVDPYQVMAMCAVQTKKIRFGTAVTNMVYRDPTITANSFATLNEISQVAPSSAWAPATDRLQLGRTATKLVDFEKGLRMIRDLLHDRGIDVPEGKERAGGNVQPKSASAPCRFTSPPRTENAPRRRTDLRRRYPRHRL